MGSYQTDARTASSDLALRAWGRATIIRRAAICQQLRDRSCAESCAARVLAPPPVRDPPYAETGAARRPRDSHCMVIIAGINGISIARNAGR